MSYPASLTAVLPGGSLAKTPPPTSWAAAKDPAVTETYAVDLSQTLTTLGTTISGAVTVVMSNGVTAATPVVAGSLVTVSLSGGTSGQASVAAFTIPLQDGATLHPLVYLEITAGAAIVAGGVASGTPSSGGGSGGGGTTTPSVSGTLSGLPTSGTAGTALSGGTYTLTGASTGYVALWNGSVYTTGFTAVSGASGSVPGLTASAASTEYVRLCADSAGVVVLATSPAITFAAANPTTTPSSGSLVIGTTTGTAADGGLVAGLQATVVDKISPTGTITAGHAAVFSDGTGLTLKDGGAIPTSTGTVNPSGTATVGHVAVFGNASGTVIEDGGTPATGTVTHSGTVTSGHLAVFADATGNTLKDGGAVPSGGTTLAVPASAALLGSDVSGALEAVTPDASLTLTGGKLSVAQTAPSAQTAAATLTGTEEIPASQANSGASYNVNVTPAQIAAYVAGAIEEAPNALPAAAALTGTEGVPVSQGNSGASFNVLATLAQILAYLQAHTTSTPSESGSISVGSSTATVSTTVSFTFGVSNVSTPFVGWAAHGSTTVGASNPSLVGSSVAVSGTSGGITAPATAASYDLILLDASAGKVLAISTAVTISAVAAVIPAMTLVNPVFGSGGPNGQKWLTGGYGYFPASVLPTSGSWFIVVSALEPPTGNNSSIISTSSALLYLTNHDQSTLYTGADNSTNYGTYGSSAGITDSFSLANSVSAGHVLAYLNESGSTNDTGSGLLPTQTGSVYIGASGDGSGSLTANGGAFGNVAVFTGDPNASGFVWPVTPYTSDNRLVAYWSLNGNGNGVA